MKVLGTAVTGAAPVLWGGLREALSGETSMLSKDEMGRLSFSHDHLAPQRERLGICLSQTTVSFLNKS